jgi:hypothetical protein
MNAFVQKLQDALFTTPALAGKDAREPDEVGSSVKEITAPCGIPGAERAEPRIEGWHFIPDGTLRRLRLSGFSGLGI